MIEYFPAKLLEFIRDGLVEQEHFGFLVKISSDGNVFKLGDDKNYPFYLRSCAKPLQASLIIDFGLDEFYIMTSEEIAICCASHTGEPCHTQTVKGLLNKIGLDESYLKCGLHKPLSKTEQDKLILSDEKETVLQNNCSGKHAMMLAICKKMDWDLSNYDEKDHPLQIAIKEKIYELCECECDYPSTKDGCGVPIYAMPLENMVRGYLNLFLNEKYSKIRDAFIQNPYLIGGEDRLDTAIMEKKSKSLKVEKSKSLILKNYSTIQLFDYSTIGLTPHSSLLTSNLIAKVGAGGLCIVINLEKKEGLIIKIMDCDMKARAICLIEGLFQLNWLSEKALQNSLITAQNKKDILTLHGEKIGQAKTVFNLFF